MNRLGSISGALRRPVRAITLALSVLALVAAIAATALMVWRQWQADGTDVFVTFPVPPSAVPTVQSVHLAPVSLAVSTAAAQLSPDYPIYLARSAQPADPGLVDWLTHQRQGMAAHDALDAILARTPVNSLWLFRIGRAFHDVSPDDIATASLLSAAALKADAELSATTNNSVSARPIVLAMIGAKPILWDIVDRGQTRFVHALYVLNIDLAHWISPQDKPLASARLHGYIGAAECLSLLGRFNESLAEVDGLNSPHRTPDQQASIAWVRGQAFFALHQYQQALDQFRLVSGIREFKYSFDANRMTVMALARLGQVAQANSALDQFIRSRRPTVQQIAPLLLAIDAGATGVASR
jgi:tetratricopeptide (TPR) repeat protein